MKKILIALILLIPVFAAAQVPDTVVLRTVDLKQISISPAGVRTFQLVPVDDSARQLASSAQLTANSAATSVAAQGVSISNMQLQVNGILVQVSPVTVDIYDDAYTLKYSDNGKTLFIRGTCTVTCPSLPADFKCRIVRTGTASSAVVTISGALSVYGYKRLLQPEAAAEIYYDPSQKAHMDGRLSK